MKQHQLEPDVLEVLARCTANGNDLRLPVEQLDRKLYQRVDKVLVAEGGKWNRSARVHRFPCSAVEILARLKEGVYQDAKRDYDVFETPPDLAQLVVDTADIKPGMTVLEPSAGRGALALRAIEAGGQVCAVEILADNVCDLRSWSAAATRTVKASAPGKLWEVHQANFLAWNPPGFVDRVVMNPPFSSNQDVAHVTRAFGFLWNRGKLVAIMSAGVKFRQTACHRQFRNLVEGVGGSIEDLPKGSFRPSGTDVNVVLVTMQRTHKDG